jgi:hypothetical protein
MTLVPCPNVAKTNHFQNWIPTFGSITFTSSSHSSSKIMLCKITHHEDVSNSSMVPLVTWICNGCKSNLQNSKSTFKIHASNLLVAHELSEWRLITTSRSHHLVSSSNHICCHSPQFPSHVQVLATNMQPKVNNQNIDVIVFTWDTKICQIQSMTKMWSLQR